MNIGSGNGLVNKMQWNTTISTQGKQFENVVCKMMCILSRPLCVDTMYPEKTEALATLQKQKKDGRSASSIVSLDNQGHGLLSKIHVQSRASWQELFIMASDWLVPVMSANQIPDLKSLLTNMDYNMEINPGSSTCNAK